MVALKEICEVISSRFPEKVAEDWDNVGLLLGRRSADIRRVLVALELTPEVALEAIESDVQLILTHHPFIFKPLKSISDSTPEGRVLLDLAEHKIALLAAHTNLDAAPQAISEKLANDLHLINRQILLPHQPYDAYKIIVFVPEENADTVADAMHEAGAGNVGSYSKVSFRGRGEGRFTCGADAHPAIGQPGTSESVQEIRLEMVVSARELGRVVQAMIAAHPYEEPAYDVFKLESDVHQMTDLYGFGISGELPEKTSLFMFVAALRKLWDTSSLRIAGEPDKTIRHVAILNGSGARYLTKCKNIDAYITGDCGHHDFDNARRLGVALIDAGHYDTEKFIPEILLKTLKESSLGDKLEIDIAKSMSNPMWVY